MPTLDPKGPWRSGDVRNALERENLKYNLPTPSGRVIAHPPKGWRWSWDTIQRKIKSGEVIFSEDETRIIRKIYLNTVEGRAAESVWFGKEVGTTRDAAEELKAIFGSAALETPKPVDLVKKVISLSTDEEDLVLDSFAGSAPTAQAVLEMNNETGGNRKFILVECEDYADTLTAERVRRVIQGYAFEGTQREELLRESLTWTKLKKAAQLVAKAESAETFHANLYDNITKTVKDGELVVTGEKKVTEKTEGLGGSFTFVTLGPEMSLDKLLADGLPTFAALAKYVFFTATGRTLTEVPKQNGGALGFLGETDLYRVHLHYKQDRDWLRSNAAALTEPMIGAMVAANARKKKLLVFAAAKFMGQRELSKWAVDFCQLPYAIHRLLGD